MHPRFAYTTLYPLLARLLRFENSSQQYKQYKHGVASSEVDLVEMCLFGFNLLPACPHVLDRGSSVAALLLVFFFCCSSSLSYGLVCNNTGLPASGAFPGCLSGHFGDGRHGREGDCCVLLKFRTVDIDICCTSVLTIAGASMSWAAFGA